MYGISLAYRVKEGRKWTSKTRKLESHVTLGGRKDTTVNICDNLEGRLRAY